MFVGGLCFLFAPKAAIEKLSQNKNAKHIVRGWPLH